MEQKIKNKHIISIFETRFKKMLSILQAEQNIHDAYKKRCMQTI